jgi:putative ABC transport system permease protein
MAAEELDATIGRLVAEGQIAQPEAVAAVAFGPVSAQSPEMVAPAGYVVNGMDDAFFATHRLELGGWARGYNSAAEVWAAVQNDPTLIVIDNFSIDRGGDPTAQRADDAFAVNAISASAATFDPVPVMITGAGGVAREFTVIGFAGSAPAFFGATMNAEAAASLGYDRPNRYFLRLPEGAGARATANALESAFGRSGLQTSLPKVDLEGARGAVRSIFYLIQGFIGLGLLIGIAALGVVTIRAVVERRQQIGVLRAIGFTREMVQNVFLFEGLFISGLATIIGYGLALTFAYNLYLQVAADQGLAFVPPWGLLLAIGVVTVVTSLVTAWLPARATAKVTIAEALHYE